MEQFNENNASHLQGKPVSVNSVIQAFNPILSERKLALVSEKL